jgi:formylglycine-generating enzyme required for sulfatase activity
MMTSCINGVCAAQPLGTGGATGTGGNSSSGGTTATGGTSSTGGTIASGGEAGAGCTGAFETTKNISGQSLCVAKMVNVPIPTVDGGSTVYEIDATEVTQGQYGAWLGTNPALPASTDTVCGWKSTYAVQTTVAPDADHYPVAYVDWCDAYWYCAGVGKRLCGRIGGGANNTNDVNTVGYDQWYTVCTSNGAVDASGYPYGEGYAPLVCNGVDAGQGGPVVVGTMTNCQPSWPGYAGVFDLSGNVAEWEDSCDADTGMYDGCRIRGGAFDNLGFSPAQPGELLSCGSMIATNRLAAVSDIGFHCCSL